MSQITDQFLRTFAHARTRPVLFAVPVIVFLLIFISFISSSNDENTFDKIEVLESDSKTEFDAVKDDYKQQDDAQKSESEGENSKVFDNGEVEKVIKSQKDGLKKSGEQEDTVDSTKNNESNLVKSIHAELEESESSARKENKESNDKENEEKLEVNEETTTANPDNEVESVQNDKETVTVTKVTSTGKSASSTTLPILSLEKILMKANELERKMINELIEKARKDSKTENSTITESTTSENAEEETKKANENVTEATTVMDDEEKDRIGSETDAKEKEEENKEGEKNEDDSIVV